MRNPVAQVRWQYRFFRSEGAGKATAIMRSAVFMLKIYYGPLLIVALGVWLIYH